MNSSDINNKQSKIFNYNKIVWICFKHAKIKDDYNKIDNTYWMKSRKNGFVIPLQDLSAYCNFNFLNYPTVFKRRGYVR